MAKNLFNSIQLFKPKKNVFDLSHDVKLSANMGELVPIMCTECVPGDKFNIGCESLIRFAPLVSPVMHRMDVTMHYYFIPNRVVWPGWEDWIVNKPGAPAFPYIDIDPADMTGNYTRLMNYLGIGRNTAGDGAIERVSALAFAAYQLVCNEYYRDQNLMDEIVWQCVNGSNTLNTDLTTLRNRCWQHDYFTSALPFAQKGAAVDIPLGDVELKPDVFEPGKILDAATHNPMAGDLKGALDGDLLADAGAGNVPSVYDPNGTLQTEATTINDLRRAIRLQEWFERNARAGTRYVENILAHFGVKSSDKRLQRPEYITGIKSPVMISEVLNTTGTEDAPQGNMAGHGVAVTTGKYGNYYCEEHGYIIGIMSVMPMTAYQQGIPRHFNKFTDPFQYYWPTFAHIGEQEVLTKEIFAFGNNSNDVFGYNPRYSEYKYEPSRVAGEFNDSLDFWHLGRKFATRPQLNEEFVQANPTHRVFAVTDEEVQKLYCHVYNKVKAIRPMPKFGTPTM